MANKTNNGAVEPYSDERMAWDGERKRYFLTEEALVESGTDLRAMLSANDTVGADFVIRRVLTHATAQIYNYIHSTSVNNERQDNWIAKVPSLRPIIYNALLNQVEYLLSVGDPTRTLNRDNRAMGVDENAKAILDTVIPELGIPITYSGV